MRIDVPYNRAEYQGDRLENEDFYLLFGAKIKFSIWGSAPKPEVEIANLLTRFCGGHGVYKCVKYGGRRPSNGGENARGAKTDNPHFLELATVNPQFLVAFVRGHHPRPMCKNWLVKNFLFLVTRRSKKIPFLGADPQTGSGIPECDGGIRSRRGVLPYREKIAPIGSETGEISRIKEIRSAPPSGQTGTGNSEWSPEFRRGAPGLRRQVVWRPSAFKRRRRTAPPSCEIWSTSAV